MPRSCIFIETNGGRVEIELPHTDAKAVIAEYRLPNSEKDEDADLHEIGAFRRNGPAYYINLRA